MANHNRQRTRRQVIWQDIVPAKPISKLRQKKPARTLEIRISLPHFFSSKKFINFNTKITKYKKAIWIIAAILTLLLIGLFFVLQDNNSVPPNIKPNDDSKPIDTGADSNQPKYNTITPGGKNIGQLGGWTRVSPINSNPVFAYVDYIDNIPIRVSQQPLPDGFDQDTTAQIDQLAIGYNANEKITVDNISVHIGTNSKGPQSVIFVKNNLLILITSSAKITNDQWANYISSLQ
ncbi:MAG TPA: hypothetical protein PKC86_02120 [Candidatus Saccharibacteria bacterium]|nr:hypothetical protein [Candidatus Saccharibacteria bacterium]